MGAPQATVDRFGIAASPGPGGPPLPLVSPADRFPPETSGRMLTGRAWALAAVAIGIGVAGVVVSSVLGANDRLEPAAYLRYVIVITLGVYAAVGALIVTRLVPGVSLQWHRGRPATSILVGAAIGGALGFGLLGLSSAAAGHLSSDPRFVLLMSEGDLAHIVVSFGIA